MMMMMREEKTCEDSKVEVVLRPTPSNVLRLQFSYGAVNEETLCFHLTPEDVKTVTTSRSGALVMTI